MPYAAESGGVLETGDRLIVLAGQRKRVGEIEPAALEIGIEPDRFATLLERLRSPLQGVDPAQMCVYPVERWIIRHELQYTAKAILGLAEIAELGQDDAQLLPRLGRAGIELDEAGIEGPRGHQVPLALRRGSRPEHILPLDPRHMVSFDDERVCEPFVAARRFPGATGRRRRVNDCREISDVTSRVSRSRVPGGNGFEPRFTTGWALERLSSSARFRGSIQAIVMAAPARKSAVL